MLRSTRDDLGPGLAQLERCVATETDGAINLWVADLGDALFTIARALRAPLAADQRAAVPFGQPMSVDALRASLLDIVEGLETEVLNSRWRLLSMRKADRLREYLALRNLARFLVAALRNLQREEGRAHAPCVYDGLSVRN
jgi:hypothetical protein